MTDTCIFCDDPATRWCDFVLGFEGEPGALMASINDPILRCDAPLCEKHAAHVGNMFVSGKTPYAETIDYCCSHDPLEDHFRPMRMTEVEQYRIKHRRAARGLRVIA